MKTKLIRIGNSQGVRIPKPIIEEIGLSEEIEMILKDNQIILRSAEQTRKGWDSAFEKMAKEDDDQLIDKKSKQDAYKPLYDTKLNDVKGTYIFNANRRSNYKLHPRK